MQIDDLIWDIDSAPAEHIGNLHYLLDAMNTLEKAYGKPFKVTSGYRTMKDHVRIYREINAKRKEQKKTPFVIPLKSNHLIGLAADIFDPKQDLKLWVSENLHFCEDLNLYMERFDQCPNWIHFQRVAPASGNRFFGR